MSKFYNTSLDRVPNTGGSVRLTISSNVAHQTTSTPCKKVWLLGNHQEMRVMIGDTCTSTNGIPIPWAYSTTWNGPAMEIEIDDINQLYFYAGADGKVVDILWRE